MNTNAGEMRHRCPDSVCIGSAVLADHKFQFNIHADVLPCSGGAVHGVLWRISSRCLANLDILEGYPDYYRRKLVEVVSCGSTYTAWVYYMAEAGVPQPPSNFYLDCLLEGYTEHGLDTAQISSALLEIDEIKI